MPKVNHPVHLRLYKDPSKNNWAITVGQAAERRIFPLEHYSELLRRPFEERVILARGPFILFLGVATKSGNGDQVWTVFLYVILFIFLANYRHGPNVKKIFQ